MAKSASYSRFFHPGKSPHAMISITGKSYVPKHSKSAGKLVWNSKKQGTFKGDVSKLKPRNIISKRTSKQSDRITNNSTHAGRQILENK